MSYIPVNYLIILILKKMEKSAISGNKNKNSYKFGKFHQTFECIKLGGNYIYIYISPLMNNNHDLNVKF
jgi:hypothetical protein